MDAKISLGEPRVLVSREALLHNASVVRRTVGPGVKVCAMIKADAYGHGADIVADTLANFSTRKYEAPLVDALAVASIDEAERLPHTILPVYVLRPVENCFLGRQRSRIEQAIRNGWIMTVCSGSAADDVARIATSIGKRAAIQLMIDTGMTRSGVLGEELGALLDTIDSHASLKLVGLCTHFACAEDLGSEATAEQLRLFTTATDAVAPRLKNKVIRHAANSAAIFLRPETHLDMVRPGIALYGVDPCLAPSSERLLKPVMKWTAPLVQIHDVKSGAAVGYGQTWRATRDTRIGLVPVGYADGYPRCLTNHGVMVVQGQACPVAGRVSMDLTTIDLTNAPHAVLGDEVIVLDSDPLSPASVYELARLAGTIPYEITSGIGQRIHRVPIEIEQGVPAQMAGLGEGASSRYNLRSNFQQERFMASYPGLDVSNKVCLVTGGTSGIGRAIALGFAQAGAKVVAGSTNPAKVSAIKMELGAGHEAVTMNVADEASVAAAVDFAVKKFGRLDVIVNAAGVIKRQPSLEMSVEEFRRIVDVNLTGSFLVAQAAARVMKDQTPDARGERGNIILIASLNSYISLVEVLAYAASKSGVLGLVRGLANEWAPLGLRVNAIAPGVFPTDLNRPLIEGTERGKMLKWHTPMGRFGAAEELVGAAIYLASPSASYTSGHTIIVDGGFLSKGV